MVLRRVVNIASSFATDPLREPFHVLQKSLPWSPSNDTTMIFSDTNGYGRIIEQLTIGADSEFMNKDTVLNVVLFRFEDWCRSEMQGPKSESGGDQSRALERIETGLKRLHAAVCQYAKYNAGARELSNVNDRAHVLPLLLIECASSPAAAVTIAGSESNWTALREASLQQLRTSVTDFMGKCWVVAASDMRELFPDVCSDSIHSQYTDTMAHVPYENVYYAALALAIARHAFALVHRHTFKVYVVDCDWTLWSGAVSEEGPSGVRMTEPHLQLQRSLKRIRDAGGVVCLASKNDEDDVWAVFDQQKDRMILKREDIAAASISWDAKSTGVVHLSSVLNISVTAASWVFIDDNPVEILGMQQAVPNIQCIHFPIAADDMGHAVNGVLRHQWVLDTLPIIECREHKETAGQARGAIVDRTAMYQANMKKYRAVAGIGNGLGHADVAGLLSLHVTVDLRDARPGDLERVAQLSLRTNQFNSTTRRRTENQVIQWTAGDKGASSGIIVGDVSDVFGEYGTVVCMFWYLERLSPQAVTLVLDSFLLSCRSFDRHVEHTGLRQMSRKASALGAESLRCEFIASPKNSKVWMFYQAVHAALCKLATASDGAGGARNDANEAQSTGQAASYTKFLDDDGIEVHTFAFDAALLGALEFESIEAEKLHVAEAAPNAPVISLDSGTSGRIASEIGTPDKLAPVWKNLNSGLFPLADPTALAEFAQREWNNNREGTMPTDTQTNVTNNDNENNDNGDNDGGEHQHHKADGIPWGLETLLGCLNGILGRHVRASDGDQSLHELGLDSLGVVRLFGMLQRKIGERCGENNVVLSHGIAFEYPTVNRLGRFLDSIVHVDDIEHGYKGDNVDGVTDAVATMGGSVKSNGPKEHDRLRWIVVTAVRTAIGKPAAAETAATENGIKDTLALGSGDSNWERRPLVEFGLDAMTAPLFMGELERRLGSVPPSMGIEGIENVSVSSVVRIISAHSHTAVDNTIVGRDETEATETAPGAQQKGACGAGAKGLLHFERSEDIGSGLHCARHGNIDALARLVASGVWSAAKVRDKHGLDALQWAAGGGHDEVVEYLLGIGIPADTRSKEGRTPLMWACRNGHVSTARLLVAAGADVNATTKKEANALMWGVWGQSIPICEWLLDEAGANMASVNRSGCSAAIWAATSGGVEMCEWLLGRGADFTITNTFGHGAVVKAAWRGNLELLHWLFDKVSSLHMHLLYQDGDGLTPLLLAESRGHTETAAWLRERMPNDYESMLVAAPSLTKDVVERRKATKAQRP